MEGWIKLHRSSFDHWLYKTKKPKSRREAWEDMIVLANYEPKKSLIRGQLYLCDRGQSLLSLESWAKQFNWSVQMVRTFFNLLEKDEMITLEGLQYTTRLTICNYDSYQGSSTDEKHANQQTANKPLTDGQQTANKPLTTTKESKEVKKDKKVKNIKEEAFLLIEFSKSFFEEKYLNGKSTELFSNLLNEYSVEQIKEAIKNAKNDLFWCKNFLSPIKLNNKNKDQVKYIDVFLKIKQNGTNTADAKSAIKSGSKSFEWDGWKPGQ